MNYPEGFRSVRVACGLVAALMISDVAALAEPKPLPVRAAVDAGFSPERLDRMHAKLRSFVDEGVVSGYVSLLARDGHIVDWRAAGQRDLAAGLPMERDTLFRVYSISKIVTAVAVLQLMEDGKLRLDDPMEVYLPELKDRQVWAGGTMEEPVLVPAKTPPTIRHLLTHTAGYYYDSTADAPIKALATEESRSAVNTREEFLAYVAKMPLHDEPGTVYRYSISYAVLGAIVERVSGRGLDAYTRERIFRPLGMNDTGFFVTPEQRARLARIYNRDKDGHLVVDTVAEQRVPPSGTFVAGGGGVITSAGDLVRFGQMLLNQGRLGETRILGRKAVELMCSDQLRGLPMPLVHYAARDSYGLGVSVATDLGKSSTLGSVGSFGWTGAATQMLMMDPQERLVAIMLCQHRPAQRQIYGYFLNMAYAALDHQVP